MVYQIIGRILPKKLLEKYKQMLFYSGIKIPHEKFAGFLFIFGLGFGAAAGFDLGYLFQLPFLWTFIISFFISQIFGYFWLILRADARARFIEKMLPDALQLMSSNLRSGLTADRALLQSSRPEFGPLKDELDRVGRKVITGKSISEALLTMATRVKSEKLTRTINLLVSGMSSGGELASLLSHTAKNLRQQEFVQERIRSNVLTYVIFIFAAVGVGAPVLFALSSFLVEVLTNVLTKVQLPTSSTMSMPLSISQPPITPSFIFMYVIIFLATTSFFASLIIGLIRWGKEKAGLKYVPFLLAFTMILFFLTRKAIKGMIGGLFLT